MEISGKLTSEHLFEDLGLTEEEIQSFTEFGEFNRDAYLKYLDASLNEDVLFSPEEAMLYALNEEYVVDDTNDEGGTEEESSEKETKKREPGKTERILSKKTYPDR